MVNTAHLGFTLTWWTATLWRQREQDLMGQQHSDAKLRGINNNRRGVYLPFNGTKAEPTYWFHLHSGSPGVVMER